MLPLFEFCHFLILPLFKFCHFLDSATIRILPLFEFCHYLNSATIWILPLFKFCNFLNFATIWILPLRYLATSGVFGGFRIVDVISGIRIQSIKIRKKTFLISWVLATFLGATISVRLFVVKYIFYFNKNFMIISTFDPHFFTYKWYLRVNRLTFWRWLLLNQNQSSSVYFCCVKWNWISCPNRDTFNFPVPIRSQQDNEN